MTCVHEPEDQIRANDRFKQIGRTWWLSADEKRKHRLMNSVRQQKAIVLCAWSVFWTCKKFQRPFFIWISTAAPQVSIESRFVVRCYQENGKMDSKLHYFGMLHFIDEREKIQLHLNQAFPLTFCVEYSKFVKFLMSAWFSANFWREQIQMRNKL